MSKTAPVEFDPVSPVSGIAGDRRFNRRFQVTAPVEYRVFQRGRCVAQGMASAVDISSTGIRFKGEESLPVGASIEVRIVWPTVFEDYPASELRVRGTITRSDHGSIGVKAGRVAFSRKFPKTAPTPQAVV
jgi:hypothetical protein